MRLEYDEHHRVDDDDDVTDSTDVSCGWRVLPEAAASQEGAGFYLQLCCQCVSAVGHAVITCVEYSSKFGMLVITVCPSVRLSVCLYVSKCMYIRTYVSYTYVRTYMSVSMYTIYV